MRFSLLDCSRQQEGIKGKRKSLASVSTSPTSNSLNLIYSPSPYGICSIKYLPNAVRLPSGQRGQSAHGTPLRAPFRESSTARSAWARWGGIWLSAGRRPTRRLSALRCAGTKRTKRSSGVGGGMTMLLVWGCTLLGSTSSRTKPWPRWLTFTMELGRRG